MEADPPDAAPPKRKRRWFQFSLRTLIVSTVTLGAAAGWIGKWFEQKREQRRAVAAIVEAGGSVKYDYQKEGTSAGPRWLRWFVDDDLLGNVVEVNLAGLPVREVDLACLDKFEGVLKLDLSSSEITDESLALLRKLPRLESLDISSTRITDAGLVHLANLQGLRSISIRNDQATWSAHHAPPPTTVVYFGTLDLNANDMLLPTSASVRPVPARMSHEEDADHQPRITDTGLDRLGRLSSLESLDIEGTNLTSQGIVKLKGLTHLTYLNIRGTNVSEAAIAELKAALPRLKVDKHFPPRTSDGIGDRYDFPLSVPDALIDFSK